MQYTIRNRRIPGCPVVIRTHNRALAVSWCSPGYLIIPRERDRTWYGLRTMIRRAASFVQYALFDKDKYLNY